VKQLHLGVVDVGYSDKDGVTTTGDVAEYLENDYHVMRTFLELNEGFIAETLVNQVAGAIESIAQGNHISLLDLKPAMGKVEERFRDFLDSGEMQRTLPTTQPIKAADAGVNHRKKHPYAAKNKPRQAFIDTGLYQASFRAWID